MGTINRIQSQSFELEFTSNQEQTYILNTIRDVVYEEVNPALELLMNELKFIDEIVIKEEHLTIDLGILSENNWKEELKIKTVEELRKWLNAFKPSYVVGEAMSTAERDKSSMTRPKVAKSELERNYVPSLIYFLKNGYFLWDSPFQSIEAVEHDLRIKFIDNTIPLYEKKEFIMVITEMMLYPQMIYRWKEQFSHSFLNEFKERLNNESKLKTSSHELEKYSQKKKETFSFENADRIEFVISIVLWYSTFFKNDFENFTSEAIKKLKSVLLLNVNDFEEEVRYDSEYIDSILLEKVLVKNEDKKNFKENEIQEKKHPKTMDSSNSISTKSTSFFIKNAGLVLLHPYLSMLFQRLKYINEENQWVDNYFRNRIPLLLQYLVTGRTKFDEHELVFNKFLCGIPFHEPVPSEIWLTEEEINTCQGLLESVIGHWTVLKSTSIDGLRNSFLIRDGKLSREETWQLTVDSKAWDVLLANLPWTISIVKNLWMDELLYVHWA